jgi:hypothetical protein
MTEKEWLKCDDVLRLVKLPALSSQRRKYRLFGCGCCRQLGSWLSNPRAWRMIDASERYADGLIRDSALAKWEREAEKTRNAVEHPPGRTRFLPEWIAAHAICYACTNDRYAGWGMVVEQILDRDITFSPDVHSDLNRRFVDLLRDIFGNPFRPVAFDPAWRSESAVALACTAYESRNFTLLPILADALEEAGCDHPDILTHCRQPDATHVRGCWVVDLVLGKC